MPLEGLSSRAWPTCTRAAAPCEACKHDKEQYAFPAPRSSSFVRSTVHYTWRWMGGGGFAPVPAGLFLPHAAWLSQTFDPQIRTEPGRHASGNLEGTNQGPASGSEQISEDTMIKISLLTREAALHHARSRLRGRWWLMDGLPLVAWRRTPNFDFVSIPSTPSSGIIPRTEYQ
jgi:hypothetical protein